ncbi:hypothetical protein AB0H18_14710 [Streptomyces sp. NPDC020766]|uniref:hypothetical protein n=1 Tax=Streptomyces sp. NPDC020766 TaxID=3155011 RepID=UPI0033DB26F9
MGTWARASVSFAFAAVEGGGQVLHAGGAVAEVDEGVEVAGPGVHLEQQVRQVDLRSGTDHHSTRSHPRST